MTEPVTESSTQPSEHTATPSETTPQEQQPKPQQQQEVPQTPQEDANVVAFREGISSLIVPHLELCSTDLNAVFAAQEKILTELKRMEAAIGKLSRFKNLPKLTQYCDRVKTCRKRVTNLSALLNTIQGRINKFLFLSFLFFPYLSMYLYLH